EIHPLSLHDALPIFTNAFAAFNAHIHYSAKANANLSVLRALIEAGAGIDAVSAGEAFRALQAGCAAENIVFAGVGKREDELRWRSEEHTSELQSREK